MITMLNISKLEYGLNNLYKNSGNGFLSTSF